jgi:predicted nucleotidyltransferase
VSDVYDWYKQGMAVSDLDDADPRTFNRGVPHTVFAFGSEQEEHRMIPLLKRLGFSLHDIDSPKDYEKAIRASDVMEHLEEIAGGENKCPPAIQDITLNLKNRQKAIDEYGYGPLNPDMPNRKFWMKKVDEWNLDGIQEAQQSLCGNCAAFDIRQETLDCIAQGIDSGNPEDAKGVIDAGDLGYCKFLKFKCASRRTCDAWVTGGPLVDEQDVAEGKQPGQPVTDAILKAMPIAQEIWFHGSRATGKHRKNSDTDILVVVPDDLVGDQYLGVVRILQKLSRHFDNYDIQPTKSGTNIHRIAQEEGRLLWSNRQGAVQENFHDGKNPQDRGDSARHGIAKKSSLSSLDKIVHSKTASPRKKQLAHWQANMRRGRAKKS